MVSAGIDPQTVVLEEAARRVDANHAIAQPTAQTIAPAIPEMMLVAAPVVQISPQAAGTPCGPGGTWLMHASHALSVASRYPPAKATGISRLNTNSNQAFLMGAPLLKAERTVAVVVPHRTQVGANDVGRVASQPDLPTDNTSADSVKKSLESDRGAGQKFRVHEVARRLLRALTGSLKRSAPASVTSSRFHRFREGPNHA
jgi:hypothetical protein